MLVVILGTSVLAESGLIFGLVLPSTTALLSLGVLIGVGAVPVPLGYGAAVLAAAGGASLAWRSGSRNGPAMRTSRFGRWVGEPRWQMADDILATRGNLAIALAQFVIVARTLVPRLVGMGGTPYARFASISVPTATLWACLLTGLGHFGGASLDAVRDQLGDAALAAAIIGGLIFLLFMAGQVIASNPQWGGGPLARATRLPFQKLRHAVDGTAERVVPGRVAPIVAGLLWWGIAVLVSALSILIVEYAVHRSGVAALNETVAEYFIEHTSRDFVRLAKILSSQILILCVLAVFYAATAFALTRDRRQVGRSARLRLATTTFGITVLAYVTGYFEDALGPYSPNPIFITHRVDAQLTIVPTALALAIVVAEPWLSRRARITAWSGVGIVGVLLAASHLVTGRATFSQIVAGLAISVMWAVMLAAAITPPDVAAPQDTTTPEAHPCPEGRGESTSPDAAPSEDDPQGAASGMPTEARNDSPAR